MEDWGSIVGLSSEYHMKSKSFENFIENPYIEMPYEDCDKALR